LVRGALVDIHNLTTLLESPRVARATVDEVLPEALAGVAVLRRVFRDSAVSPARIELCAFVTSLLDRFESSAEDFRGGARGVRERLRFERVANAAAHELDVAGELLELASRATEPQPTHLAAAEAFRDALTTAFEFVAPERALALVTTPAPADTSVFAHAFVLRRMFAVLVAEGIDWNQRGAFGGPVVVLEPVYSERMLTLTSRSKRESEANVSELTVRTFRTIKPARAILHETASLISATVVVRDDGLELSLPRALA